MRRIFFDLETKSWSEEVEGRWSNIAGFGLSVAVTWDGEDKFRDWFESNVEQLVRVLAQFDRIIGFNLLRFDYEVLSSYVPDVHQLLDKKTLDILAYVEARIGRRVSLENVALATLGKHKLGTGWDAVRWFQEGRINKVVDYCRRDVDLTREIYEYGEEHGFIYFGHRGERVSLGVQKSLFGEQWVS